MRHVRLGHEPAFEEIYERHHRGILSFCRHMLGSREEAEDAVQHTFIAAYRDLRGSDKPIHLKAWLYTIARNRCLSMLRARREQVSIDDVEPATEGLASEVQRRQDLQDMLRDLQRLPADQRAALVLSELGALSHEEIAMTLDVRKEKVKALVFQARESLANSRQARNADCTEIQKQLAVLRGGSLRRTTLRRHVEQCQACQAFKDEVQRQRAAMAIILPVAPTAALKGSILGGAAAAAGGVAGGAAGGVAGGAAGGAALAGAGAGAGGAIGTKLIVGALLAGAGVGGGLLAVDDLRSPPQSAAKDGERRQEPELRTAGGDYLRADARGRPAETEPAAVVDRLRARAQAVAAEREADRRVASGIAVWGTAIPGDSTGTDPAAVVTIVSDALEGLGGPKPGKGAEKAKGADRTKGAHGPQKAKKDKVHQGLGAQGKGHGYGRGREPGASAGKRPEHAGHPGKAKANGESKGNGRAQRDGTHPGQGNANGQGTQPPGQAGSPPAQSAPAQGNRNATGGRDRPRTRAKRQGAPKARRTPAIRIPKIPKVKADGRSRRRGANPGRAPEPARKPAPKAKEPAAAPPPQSAPPPQQQQPPQGQGDPGNGTGTSPGQGKVEEQVKSTAEQVKGNARAAVAYVAETTDDVLPQAGAVTEPVGDALTPGL